ncbi:MAG: ABC transporter ATP-binding protein [Trueperaceae bacterium]|nr:ABC transporter ATP-binding protein [Trueperaceae bacterium]
MSQHAAETAPAPSIETEALSKRYGRRPIIRDLTFRVSPGEVYALVGPNGAGKTTVIRLVSGLAFPSSGRVSMLGKNPHQHPEVRRRLGAVVEAPAAFYPYLTGRANLRLHARLAGGVADARIEELLELMELGHAAERKVGVYSLGMRQRLGVAGALLTRPDVLILDEPASGMDPLSLHLVHRVLRNAAGRGSAVLLSTHHLDEVAAYCNRVGIMEEGALIDEVDLDQRRDRYRARVPDPQAARTALATQPWVEETFLRAGQVVFQLDHADSLPKVAPLLVEHGGGLTALNEDVFDLRAYYRERVNAERARRSGERSAPQEAVEPAAPGGPA